MRSVPGAAVLVGLLMLGCKPGDVEDTGVDTEDTGPGIDTEPPEGAVVCPEPLPAAPEGELCTVTGDATVATHLLLKGVVLAEDAPYVDGGVLLQRGVNGLIECTGCDCADEAPAETLVLTCPEGVFSPGLVNSHDHTPYNLVGPVFPTDELERYDHRHDWRRGERGHEELGASSNNSRESVLYGELRMLLGGATSIVGSIGSTNASGLLRNLDDPDHDEGLDGVPVDYSTFPLGDVSPIFRASGCGDYDFEMQSPPSGEIYLPHIAEGIDPEARNEFACLSSTAGGGVDVVASTTSIVHGIGLTPADIGLIAAEGAKLVWSPRSNVHLYGLTADVVQFDHQGAMIALGTDWTPSGSATMLRELQCADYLNTQHYGGYFTDRDLWLMATRNAAIASGAAGRLGVLAEGYVGDIALFDGRERDPYRAVLDAGIQDVALVLRGSEPLHGDAGLIEDLLADATGCESLDLCGVDKSVCLQRDADLTVSGLQAAVGQGAYPLYAPDCGIPEDEPSCVPFRAEGDGILFPVSDPGDTDGDGILDDVDNCPDVFNPPRPLEGFVQGDFDDDGEGDSCDLCPLNAGDECETVDPDDVDGDGITTGDDNCPGVGNAGQEDADEDDIGDVCDACPDYGSADGACLETIYDVKMGTATGLVVLEHLVVTAVAPDGVFLQLPSGQPGYTGPDFSGIYAYMPGSAPKPAQGDRVTIKGNVQDFFDQIQITDGVVTEEATAQALPAPVTVTSAEVATGGERQEELEAVLVQVDEVAVTSVTPPVGPGDDAPIHEFVVDDGVRVNDLMYRVDPFPAVGEEFSAILGILRWANDQSKIEPRDANDVAAGPPSLAGLSHEAVLVEAGTTDASTLQVRLTRPASEETTITLACAPAETLTCPATVVLAVGEQAAAVSLTGVTASETLATVTATLGEDDDTATVRVYDDTTPRVVESLTPASSIVRFGTALPLTITLDLPAPPPVGEAPFTVEVTSAQGLVTFDSPVPFVEGERQATFTVTAGSTEGVDTLTAGAATATVDVREVVEPNLFFSQYIEGSSGNNKVVEIFNADTTPIALAGCGIRRFTNGDSGEDFTLIGLDSAATLAPGDTYVVCHGDVAETIRPKCDLENGSLNHNGDDALALVCDEVTLDVFGEIGLDPGSAWSSGGVSTANADLRRKCDVTQGDRDGSDAFDPSAEWISAGGDIHDGGDLGLYTCP